jgi:hypothetical protein
VVVGPGVYPDESVVGGNVKCVFIVAVGGVPVLKQIKHRNVGDGGGGCVLGVVGWCSSGRNGAMPLRRSRGWGH